jgi:hypothetical protein
VEWTIWFSIDVLVSWCSFDGAAVRRAMSILGKRRAISILFADRLSTLRPSFRACRLPLLVLQVCILGLDVYEFSAAARSVLLPVW